MRTIGRFVWETFAEEHVEGAQQAFDVVYSMIACERRALLHPGHRQPEVRWGCHPELIEAAERLRAEREGRGDGDTVSYYFPGGYMGSRKPLKPTLEAFHAAKGENLRLLVKAQVDSPARTSSRRWLSAMAGSS